MSHIEVLLYSNASQCVLYIEFATQTPIFKDGRNRGVHAMYAMLLTIDYIQ